MEKEKENIAYGSLYVDRGETFELVEKQINYFADQDPKPTIIFFDILGRESDRVTGEKYVPRLIQYVKEKLPYIKDQNIKCQFSVDVGY